MRWYPLGHAMALAELDGLRLLFDPLLADRHHGGVFEVVPPRELDDAALRPDFVFVSHRHPDHFDIASLRRLAALDEDSVIVTPDALVERACLRLGFRTVRRVAPRSRIELDTISVVTTPSRANDADAVEWGVAVRAPGGVVWNRVDTVFRDAADLRATVDEVESTLAAPCVLAFVPWCPLLEVDAFLAGRFGFPFAAYAQLIEEAAAIDALIVPSSAGARHAPTWSSLNALVYPVDEARLLVDLARRGVRAHASGVGGCFVIEDSVTFEPNAPFVRAREFVDDREFAPLAIPALVDPNLDGLNETAMRTQIERWVGDLASRLGRRRYLLEVVYPNTRDVFTLRDGEVSRTADPQWDIRNQVAASLLCDVIDGRRHWGDLLLSGSLRGCSRAYDVGPRGLARANDAVLFVYEAISYAESVARAVEYELSAEAARTHTRAR